jgi:hypothetical protein
MIVPLSTDARTRATGVRLDRITGAAVSEP